MYKTSYRSKEIFYTSASDAVIRRLDMVLWFNCNFQAEITVMKEILPKEGEKERERNV